MSKIIITSDSTCDLTPELIAQNNIGICPISILLGIDEYFDTVNMDAEGVLDYVEKTGTLPKTSATSMNSYTEFFKKYVDEGYKVIHFCISSKASACYQNACNAARDLKGVYVIDSASLSTGQGIQILKACDLLKEGKSAEEIVEYITSRVDKVQISFVVDTLTFLHKGGRCSSVELIGSKLLKIHPSIYSKDGALIVKKKYMGSLNRAVTQYVQDLALEFGDYDTTRCFVTHSPSDKELAELVVSKVKDLFHFDTVIESTAGSTVTSHCGRNTIGVIFINN